MKKPKKAKPKNKNNSFNKRPLIIMVCLLILLAAVLIFVWLPKDNKKTTVSQPTTADSLTVDTSNNVSVSTDKNLGQLQTEDKSVSIVAELNIKRANNRQGAFSQDATLQTRAINMVSGVTKLQTSSPPVKITIPILDDLFAKAGGTKADSTYIALVLGGCNESAKAIADQFYDRQDSFARNAYYIKIGIGIGNLGYGCNHIAVLGE